MTMHGEYVSRLLRDTESKVCQDEKRRAKTAEFDEIAASSSSRAGRGRMERICSGRAGHEVSVPREALCPSGRAGFGNATVGAGGGRTATTGIAAGARGGQRHRDRK